jgi:hypothetical protein
MKTVAKLLVEHKDKYFLQELEDELAEYKASKKLLKEIDEAYQHHFIEMCFSNLQNRKQFSHKAADLMIEDWMNLTGLMQYLQKNYSKDWVTIHDIIQLNLKEELMNVHYDIHN